MRALLYTTPTAIVAAKTVSTVVKKRTLRALVARNVSSSVRFTITTAAAGASFRRSSSAGSAARSTSSPAPDTTGPSRASRFSSSRRIHAFMPAISPTVPVTVTGAATRLPSSSSASSVSPGRTCRRSARRVVSSTPPGSGRDCFRSASMMRSSSASSATPVTAVR